MAQDVFCEVSSCRYNREGRRCGATEIHVGPHKGSKADTSEETDCKTFSPM